MDFYCSVACRAFFADLDPTCQLNMDPIPTVKSSHAQFFILPLRRWPRIVVPSESFVGISHSYST